MNAKKIISIAAVASVFLLTTATAFAQTATPAKGANQSARLSTLHTLCDNAISQRLTTLSNMNTSISNAKKLSDAQKSTYTGEITTDTNGLNTLKTKCDGDTDVTTLRTDYRSVFTQYRIYAVFAPQVHLLAASDSLSYTDTLLSQYATQLQTRISQAQSAGHDVTQANSLLSDMNAKISAANSQASSATTAVSGLTPNSYNTDPTGTHTTLVNARSTIKTGVSDAQAAYSDAKQIRQILNGWGTSGTTPTPTP